MSSKLPINVDPTAHIPLATQLGQQLTWLIVSGRISAGDELPPVRGLADQLGINLHTVRSAYHQLEADGLVSLQRGRRAQVLPYDRSVERPSWVNVPSFTIGVIIPEFAPFYGPLLRGIEAEAAESSALVFICNAHEDPNAALSYLDRLVARQVDGIIVAAPLLDPTVALPPDGKPAVVFLDSPGSMGASIEFDLQRSQYIATRHLIEHGHQRIGYITPPRNIPNVRPKYAGYLEALKSANLAPEPELISDVPNFKIRSGEEGANRLLDLPNPPTAIAASSDDLALGAFHAITSRQLDIPNNVALIGNDGIEMAAIIRPALTTVSLPVAEAGRRAVAMLGTMMANDIPKESRVVLQPELVVRETCGC